jgi:hypothetical protein
MVGMVRIQEIWHFRRLLPIATAVLVLVTFITATFAIWELREAALEDAETDLTRTSLILAEQTARSFQSVDLVVREVMERLAPKRMSGPEDFRQQVGTEELHHFLRSRLTNLPQADAIAIVAANGRVINFSRRWPMPDIDVSDREHYLHFRDNADPGVFISGPVRNRATGTWTLYLARRANGPNGEFLGLVLGAMELKYFEDFYKSIATGEGDAFALLRRDNMLLVRFPVIENAIGTTTGNAEGSRGLWSRFGNGITRLERAIDGAPRIVSTRIVGDYPIAVDVSSTEQAILQAWRRQALAIGTGAVAAMIGIGLMFLALMRQFRQIAEKTMQLEAQGAELAAARDAAQQANEAKSVFLASMSHEIRTPMNAIMGNAGLLAASPLSAEQQEWAGAVREGADALLVLIDDILDLSKLEAGKIELEAIDFTLRDVASGAVRLMQPRATEKGLKLSFSLDERAPARLRGDPTRLRQVILNLLSNAIKFTERGQVTLALEFNDCIDGRPQILIKVIDTGIGIPAGVRGRLFQKFAQADKSVSRRYGGTGLGLAICKQLVELLGGEIGVESEPGRGSTFWLRIRFDAASSPAAASVEEIPSATVSDKAQRPCRILLVEDNRLNQRLATTLLGKFGHQIEVAENGVEAVVAARKGFDLILMDIHMPGMDGVEATKRIRKEEQASGRRTPIVAMTASAMVGKREEFLADGMDDYVAKPMHPRLLFEVVARWAGAGTAAASAPVDDTASPAVATSAIDHEAIAALEESIPANQLRALVAEYLESDGARLRRIQELAASGDLDALAQEAHDLVSVAGTFGARHVQMLARTLENVCRQRLAADAARLAAEIGPVAAMASREIREHFFVA